MSFVFLLSTCEVVTPEKRYVSLVLELCRTYEPLSFVFSCAHPSFYSSVMDAINSLLVLLYAFAHTSLSETTKQTPAAHFIQSILSDARMDVNIFSNFDMPMENKVRSKKQEFLK